jgi:Beta-carotene isomerase D27-like, C-terminal
MGSQRLIKAPRSKIGAADCMDAAKNEYRDNWVDRLCIGLFSRKMAIALGKTTALRGYDGFVDLSQKIMQGRNAAQQKEVVTVVLKSLVPSPVLWMIRTIFSPTKLVCELNAWFATVLFEWLVGPCEVIEVEVTDAEGQLSLQKSGVHIKKCRYLEQSGCVGMCINMCKLPTQDFFTQDFGIPLTMTPNFEDLSCDMVFGQAPPAIEDEPIYHQPCLMTQCPTAEPRAAACPKVREA